MSSVASTRDDRAADPGSTTSPAPHFLLINQFFWPDGAPTGVLLEDLARELVRRGCRVTVINSRASYAEARDDLPPPVRIVAVPALPYARTALGRLISWLSFLAGAGWRSLFIPHVDLVLTMTSPPGLSIIGTILKAFRGCRFWIWEMDLYPDVATALGAMPKDSKLALLALRFLTTLRRRADGIIVVGACMQARLLRHGLNPQRVAVAENWTDGRSFRCLDAPDCPPLRILYSGNLGLAHEVETIAEVMLRLSDCPDFQFIFTGGGARRAELQHFCATHNLSNVEFRPYLARHLLGASLAQCHLGLVTLRPECVGTVVPSKVYSFLAAGRPFLYIGPSDATPGRIAAEGCGWQYESGNVDSVVLLLKHLRANPDLIRKAGVKARQIFEQRYDVPQGAGHVADLLLRSTQEGTSR